MHLLTTSHPATCLLQPYHRLTQSATPRNSTCNQPAQSIGTNSVFLQLPCHAQSQLSLFLHHPSASDHSPSNYTGETEDRLVFSACIFRSSLPGIAAACGLHTASTEGCFYKMHDDGVSISGCNLCATPPQPQSSGPHFHQTSVRYGHLMRQVIISYRRRSLEAPLRQSCQYRGHVGRCVSLGESFGLL